MKVDCDLQYAASRTSFEGQDWNARDEAHALTSWAFGLQTLEPVVCPCLYALLITSRTHLEMVETRMSPL